MSEETEVQMHPFAWAPSGLGSLIAVLVIVVAIVFFITGRLSGDLAALFVALGLARLT